MGTSEEYRPKFGFDIRIKPDGRRKAPKKKPTAGKPCGVRGCKSTAESHAPKSRKNMEERVWLCAAHLRAHNEHWNFFEGMTDAEIEAHCNQANLGHRPTWPMGKRGPDAEPKGQKYWSYGFEDGFAGLDKEAALKRRPRQTALTKGQLDALDALGLEEGVTLSQVKARYKELVKRFHPDTNGGDRGKEERLKQVIKAYGHLRTSGFARGNP